MISRKDLTRLRLLIGELDLPDSFTTQDLICSVERHRGRRIICLASNELDHNAELCGLVVSAPEMDADVIFHAASLTAWHRDHTIAHELGHLMADHGKYAAELPSRLIKQMRPMLEAQYHAPLVGRMLGRYEFDSHEEQEAELFASLVLGGRSVDEHEQITLKVATVLQPNRKPTRRHTT